MISREHKTIFVHVPKVAGQSIETMFLNEYGLNWDERESLLLRKKKTFEQGPRRLAHLRARDYVDLGYMEEQEFREFYKFSFVRNPYKRVFSIYSFLGYDKIIDLETFVNKVLPIKIKTRDFFFLSQYEYLYSQEGHLLVDFVGRLENISQDIKEVIKISGLKKGTLPHINKSKGGWNRVMGHLIRTPFLIKYLKITKNGYNFEESFTKELKEKVYNLYTNDFKYFKYEK